MSVIQARTATVDIYQGDYLDRIRHLEQRYDAAVKAEDGTTRTLSEVPESHALFEEHKALVAEAEESKIVVTVGALGRAGWRALVKEHPAREGNQEDDSVGLNEETFKEALVPISILSPELSADDLDAMSDVDYDRIYYTAFALNRFPAGAPKALASPASLENQKSDEN